MNCLVTAYRKIVDHCLACKHIFKMTILITSIIKTVLICLTHSKRKELQFDDILYVIFYF
jgi:hypothetical protein